MQLNIASLALVGLTFFAAPVQASEGWIQDFDEAVKLAKEQNKDLLVDFTGSDWCSFCIKLDNEVFAFDAFKKGVRDNFILVALDFPRYPEATALVPNPKRNRELSTKYGVAGFPTVLLMNADGIVYAKTGYKKGGPESYVQQLNKFRANERKDMEKVLGTVTAFEAAQGPAKLEALGTLVDTLGNLPADSNFAPPLIEAAKTALELDPRNEHGIKLRAVQALSKARAYDAKILSAAREFDPSNTDGLWEQAVHAQFLSVVDGPTAKIALTSLDTINSFTFQDKETGFMLNFTAASWSANQMSDTKLAKRYAARAKKIGSDNKERMDVIQGMLADA